MPPSYKLLSNLLSSQYRLSFIYPSSLRDKYFRYIIVLMDNQNPQPITPDRATTKQPVVSQTEAAIPTNQQDKPKLDLSSSEAQSLLVLNDLQAGKQPKTKVPIKLVTIITVLIMVAVLASFLLGAFKPGGSSKTSGGVGLPSQSDPSSGSGASNQINQDVKACANPLNATTVC
jgi:hypothetical protein